jgi:hypothetical protein
MTASGRTPDGGGLAPPRKRWLLASAIATIMVSSLVGGVSVLSAYEWWIGGAERLTRFLTGELSRERPAGGVGDSSLEGFLLVIGFGIGAFVGLSLWRRVIGRLTTLTKDQREEVFR